MTYTVTGKLCYRVLGMALPIFMAKCDLRMYCSEQHSNQMHTALAPMVPIGWPKRCGNNQKQFLISNESHQRQQTV